MNTVIPLRILFINVADADIGVLLRELRGGGYIPDASVLHDPARLRDMLSDEFQLVVLDSLGQYPRVLADVVACLQKRQLDIPLLVYSGVDSHEHIVEVMQAGAHDFISASNTARILPAVQRELGNAQLRARQREHIVIDSLLHEIDGLILQAYDVVPLVTQICRRIGELFSFGLVWIGSKKHDGSVSVLASSGARDYLHEMEVRWDESHQGKGPVGRAIRANRPVMMRVTDPGFAPWRERAENHGIHSVLALPLVVHGEIIGTLALYATQRDAFDELAVTRFSAFSDRVAVALLVTREQQQLRLLSAGMNNAINAMFITSLDGTIDWCNKALSIFSGYAVEEMVGHNPRLFESGKHDKVFWQEMWHTVLQGKAWHNDVVNRRKDGSLITVMQNVSPLYNNRGEITHFLSIQQDVSEKKELEREIEYLAYYDALTGLPNRVLFNDRMHHGVSQAKRSKSSLALLFVDLDGFKKVNDMYGHAAGDRLLKLVAGRLRSCVRESDTVARLAGDEFTVLLRDVTDEAGLKRVAGKILECVARHYDLGGCSVTVTASVGISLFPQHTTAADKLLVYADEAMYLAKQAGKNNYRFYQQKSDLSRGNTE
ncbi:MAG TPA: diguanylate cyclase [Gallionella sp.]|nr:diguanylate cyclase [Gallionella sp.]